MLLRLLVNLNRNAAIEIAMILPIATGKGERRKRRISQQLRQKEAISPDFL
jgi:hypothetical protein